MNKLLTTTLTSMVLIPVAAFAFTPPVSWIDSDGDGISDSTERHYGWNYQDNTSPGEYDTDSDGYSDRIEVVLSTNLYDVYSFPTDFGPDSKSVPPVIQTIYITPPSFGTMIATEGNVISGSYIYYSITNTPEGQSTQTWLASGGDILQQTVGTSYDVVSLDLGEATVAANVGNTVQYCITPMDNTGVSGMMVCSAPTSPIISSGEGSLPEATNVVVNPNVGVNVSDTLTAAYDYSDSSGSAEAGSTGSWFSTFNGSTLISGPIGVSENTPVTFPLNQTGEALVAIEGSQLTFCVTPMSAASVIGSQECSTPTGTIGQRPGDSAPVATNATITGTPTPGNVLTGIYTYTDIDSDVEDTASTAFEWVNVTNGNTLSTNQTFSPTESDAGQAIQFCVTPAAMTGTTPGAQDCSLGVFIEGGIPTVVVNPLTTTDVDSTHTLSQGDIVSGTIDTSGSSVPIDVDNSGYLWSINGMLTSDTPNSSGVSSYTIQTKDEGAPIKYCVIPVSTAGEQGVLTCSDPVVSESILVASTSPTTLVQGVTTTVIGTYVNFAGNPLTVMPTIEFSIGGSATFMSDTSSGASILGQSTSQVLSNSQGILFIKDETVETVILQDQLTKFATLTITPAIPEADSDYDGLKDDVDPTPYSYDGPATDMIGINQWIALAGSAACPYGTIPTSRPPEFMACSTGKVYSCGDTAYDIQRGGCFGGVPNQSAYDNWLSPALKSAILALPY